MNQQIECPECEAVYEIKVRTEPAGGTAFGAPFCPFCKAVVNAAE